MIDTNAGYYNAHPRNECSVNKMLCTLGMELCIFGLGSRSSISSGSKSPTYTPCLMLVWKKEEEEAMAMAAAAYLQPSYVKCVQSFSAVLQ